MKEEGPKHFSVVEESFEEKTPEIPMDGKKTRQKLEGKRTRRVFATEVAYATL